MTGIAAAIAFTTTSFQSKKRPGVAPCVYSSARPISVAAAIVPAHAPEARWMTATASQRVAISLRAPTGAR